MKPLAVLSIALVGGAALTQSAGSPEYHFVSHAELREGAVRVLLEEGALPYQGDLNGTYVRMPVFGEELIIRPRMQEVLTERFNALGAEGWRLVCHDSSEGNYIFTRG